MPLHTRLHQPPSPPPCRLPPNTSSNLLSLSLPNNFLAYPADSISRISLQNYGFQSFSHARPSKPTADMDEAEDEKTDFAKLKRKVGSLGINFDSCTPGQYDLLYCPKCRGGRSIHRSLSFHISQNWSYAIWRCFHLQCGWAGQIFADTKKANPLVNIHGKVSSSRPLTGESLRLEPLGDELLAYFAERMISKETLQRNNVMQVAGDKVEGEIDKLSVEEAGYYNCVSVPGGAPRTISLKEVPAPEKDTSFQYIWNCKDYLDKASRIILATDGDIPGQALAEELARRLGRERCWRVHWPKKDELSSFKDANEVLKILGADALRDAIDKAELLHECRI